AVLAHLEGRLPGGVRLVRLSGADPAHIIEAWEGAARVFLVDAMVSGAPAGTWRRFDVAAEPLPTEVRLASTHALGAGEAIEMARVLGRLPQALTVYAIEGTTFTVGAVIGAAVATAAGEAAARILEEVCGA
ncbi:MAG: hydrogenase maturation protease, partial [Acidimicrobiia bacterium]|nr:hydrogenase maturation protease [Acidimicrobiia bacterium]